MVKILKANLLLFPFTLPYLETSPRPISASLICKGGGDHLPALRGRSPMERLQSQTPWSWTPAQSLTGCMTLASDLASLGSAPSSINWGQ